MRYSDWSEVARQSQTEKRKEIRCRDCQIESRQRMTSFPAALKMVARVEV